MLISLLFRAAVLKVVVGDHNKEVHGEHGEQVVGVRECVNHPDYRRFGKLRAIENDFKILKLSR